jgi:hypothetical protein
MKQKFHAEFFCGSTLESFEDIEGGYVIRVQYGGCILEILFMK